MVGACAVNKIVLMFANVIIGIDGGPGGRDALALARRLAARHARFTLVNVWDPREALASAVTGRPHPSTTGQELLERLRRESGLDCRIAQVGASSPQRGLQELADHVGADLLVVGTSRHGDHPRLLGDHARGALHGAPCAVAVAAEGADRIRDVAIAWDGSPGAQDALEVAREIGQAHGATLHGFTVVPPMPGMCAPEAVAYADLMEEGRGKELEHRRAELQVEGITDIRAEKGLSSADLCGWTSDVDLIVAGSRGHGPVRRLFLGSTGDALVGDAQCSVLIVPRGERLHDSGPSERALLTVI